MRDHLMGWAGAAPLATERTDREYAHSRRYRVLSAKEHHVFSQALRQGAASSGYVGEPIAVEDFNGCHDFSKPLSLVVGYKRLPDGRVLTIFAEDDGNVGYPEKAQATPTGWTRKSDHEVYPADAPYNDYTEWSVGKPTAPGWYIALSSAQTFEFNAAKLRQYVRNAGGDYERYWNGSSWSQCVKVTTKPNRSVRCELRQKITDHHRIYDFVAYLPGVQSTPV